jgi:hypothetical protein
LIDLDSGEPDYSRGVKLAVRWTRSMALAADLLLLIIGATIVTVILFAVCSQLLRALNALRRRRGTQRGFAVIVPGDQESSRASEA